jgi:hypothetical protein
MTDGNVSALSGIKNDNRFYQISAPVQGGNSGGPLVNGYGQVTGMVAAKANVLGIMVEYGDMVQNINFAIKGDLLKGFLDSNHIAYNTSAKRVELKGQNIAQAARNYTVFVECLYE